MRRQLTRPHPWNNSTPSRRRAPETQIDDKKRPRTSGDPPSEKQSTSTPALIFLCFPQIPCVLQSVFLFLSYPRVTAR